MQRRLWLLQILILTLSSGAFAQNAPQNPSLNPIQDQHPTEAGGVAYIAAQGYYLGGGSQALSTLSGMSVSFREYLPSLGFITGNLEGYADSSRGRVGLNTVTVHGLKWKGRRWTVTGGDFSFQTALVPAPFTNYTYPEISALGAKLEMSDGHGQLTLFGGEETLQAGPRITFRIHAPQSVLGVAWTQHLGARVSVGARYLGLSSAESQIEANPFFFPDGSAFRRTDSVSLQTSWSAGRGLTVFADADVSHEVFTAGASYASYTHAVPFSWLSGAKWKTNRLTVTANYGRLSRSALPVAGSYFGDRQGPFAEVRYSVFQTLELFGSALRSGNNLERNPDLPNIATQDLTAGANVTLPGSVGLSAQYSKINLHGELPSDPSQNQSQKDSSAQVSLNKTISYHSLTLTARTLDLAAQSFRQKQKSVEIQDSVSISRFTVDGAIRMQQQTGGGQLQNSLYVRGSAHVRLPGVTAYGQFEAGNDLVNKTLFATNNVRTTVLGMEIPMINRWIAHGWTLRAEAFRTTLLSTLNPASILVLQTQDTGVGDILNDFNQWSFYIRLSHRTQWGVPPSAASAFTSNQVVYGAIEGFVYDDATGFHGAPDVSVQLDGSRSATTDAAGRYRFEDVVEGGHSVVLNTAELAADYSPGPSPPGSVLVKPRTVTRVELRVVKAGSAVRGSVRGLAADDQGIVRMENIVINLVSTEERKEAVYTSCDGAGEFAFYNLKPGTYQVSIDQTTLPEHYVLLSESEVEADLSSTAEVPALVFRMEKRVAALPVRKVFEAGTP